MTSPSPVHEPVTPGGVLTRRAAPAPFEVHLDVFEGPFDLLLGLIAKHKLDVTEIALAQVTDEFIAHLRALREGSSGDEAGGPSAGADPSEEWDLGQASEFLLVAATLLDLKASRLLPSSGAEDEEDLALIEARDLLFARLLQYRAFKDIARAFAAQMAVAGRMTPRRAPLEARFARLLPELVMGITPHQLAAVAARALTPRTPPVVGLDHLHTPQVSVREQAAILVRRLRSVGACTFRELVADADGTIVIVARFLAVLELVKESAVTVEQQESLGELTIRWSGSDSGEVGVSDEFDEPDDPGEVATSE